MAMTYQSLTAQIQSYANRSEDKFNAQIPNFIEQGINRIYYAARDLGFETILANQAVTSVSLVNKPQPPNAAWRETLSLSLYNNVTKEFILLEPRSYEYAQVINSLGSTGPRYYADLNYQTILLAPNLSATTNWTYTLAYLSVPIFNAQVPTNFLTERYPSLLLYSCLVEIIPYLKDDERAQTFRQLYEEALSAVNNNAGKIKTDRAIDRELN